MHRPPGKLAVTDFAAPGKAETAGFADRERREVIVQHEGFAVIVREAIDDLTTAERLPELSRGQEAGNNVVFPLLPHHLLIVEDSASIHPRTPGVLFLQRDNGQLERVSAGPSPGIPHHVRTVVFEEGSIEKHSLLVFHDWLDHPERVIQFHRTKPEAAFRLARPGVDASSFWSHRYGLQSERGKASLSRIVEQCMPAQATWLEAVIGFAELGVSPLHEAFAGNTLYERNTELLDVVL